jgi:isoquinoline 1-oxidoreductase beta subunit
MPKPLDAWSRRGFLKVAAAAGGGLVVGWVVPVRGAEGEEEPTSHRLHTFVEIRSDGQVTLVAPVPEIGQGVRTSLPMILAEELAVDWKQVRVEQAPTDPRYGPMSVGGSDSVHDYWQPLRRIGAAVREMLIEAAAREWGVPAAECRARGGFVTLGPTGRRAG